MQVACQMVHWVQQALIKRSMDGEVRANKNEGGSADHGKGHDEISHDQETVSGEVHKEGGGDEEGHGGGEGDKGAGGARAGGERGPRRGGRMGTVSVRRGRAITRRRRAVMR